MQLTGIKHLYGYVEERCRKANEKPGMLNVLNKHTNIQGLYFSSPDDMVLTMGFKDRSLSLVYNSLKRPLP